MRSKVGYRTDNRAILLKIQSLHTVPTGEYTMALYRFYLLDSASNLKGQATRLDLPADDVVQAKQMVGGHFVEVWQGESRIGRFATQANRVVAN